MAQFHFEFRDRRAGSVADFARSRLGLLESIEQAARRTSEGLEAWDVPKSHIKVEAFGAPTKSSAPRVENLEVRFARSQRTIPWDPAMSTLLQFAEDNEISMESGCRAGSCGECQVAVRQGEVEYIREPEFQCEEGCCLTCLAIPKRNLVLEA